MYEQDHLPARLLGQGRKEINASARFKAVEAQRELLASAAHKTKAARRETERTTSGAAGSARGNISGGAAPNAAPDKIDYSHPPEILDVEEWS